MRAQFASQVHPVPILRLVLLTEQVHLPLSPGTGRQRPHYHRLIGLQSPRCRQLQLVATPSEAGTGQRVFGRTLARLGGRQSDVQRGKSASSPAAVTSTPSLVDAGQELERNRASGAAAAAAAAASSPSPR